MSELRLTLPNVPAGCNYKSGRVVPVIGVVGDYAPGKCGIPVRTINRALTRRTTRDARIRPFGDGTGVEWESIAESQNPRNSPTRGQTREHSLLNVRSWKGVDQVGGPNQRNIERRNAPVGPDVERICRVGAAQR